MKAKSKLSVLLVHGLGEVIAFDHFFSVFRKLDVHLQGGIVVEYMEEPRSVPTG
jgi:hypothetical protein